MSYFWIYKMVKKLFIFSALVALMSCDKDVAMGFQYGEVMPEFRIEVELDQKLSMDELYPKLEELVVSGGLSTSSQNRYFQGDTNSAVVPRSYTWTKDGSSNISQHRVSIIFNDGKPERDSFLIVFFFGKMTSLTLSDWLTFKQWRYQIVPDVFPSAVVKTIGHPAKFTDSEARVDIAEKSGLAWPDPVD